jgi:iron-sulfur cluster assembly accessory protein
MQLIQRHASNLACSTSARRPATILRVPRRGAQLVSTRVPPFVCHSAVQGTLRVCVSPAKQFTENDLSIAEAVAVSTPDNPIALTEQALSHLVRLRSDVGGETLLLRVGVKQGGCSGLSYNMDFEQPENVTEDDTVMEYADGKFRMVCDPKSLLYLFGMNMDYSDALIGGGFKFSNPNATDSCGCGKSFGV